MSMTVIPYFQPAKRVPPRGTFAAAYSPNGLRQRPTSLQHRGMFPPVGVAFYPAPYSIAWGAAGAENTASPGTAAKWASRRR